MITKALLFRMESQTDEDTMDTFLEDLSAEVSWEKTTRAWFGVRYMRGEFGVYSCFDDAAGLEAHGAVLLREELPERMRREPDLLVRHDRDAGTDRHVRLERHGRREVDQDLASYEAALAHGEPPTQRTNKNR